MRLVKISAPQGRGKDVVQLALDCGISSVAMHESQEHRRGGEPREKEVVDAQAATPDARALIAALVAAPFYDRDAFTIEVREPRAIYKGDTTRDITRPVPSALPRRTSSRRIPSQWASLAGC